MTEPTRNSHDDRRCYQRSAGHAPIADQPKEDVTAEIRTDGGEIDDRTQHITDDDIEHGTDGGAIQDINKVREALETFQQSAEDTWSEHMDGIEQGHYRIVEETDDVIVLAADDELYKHYLTPTGHDTTDFHAAVSGVMHSVAKRLTAYKWHYDYPLVIAKPDDQPKESD